MKKKTIILLLFLSFFSLLLSLLEISIDCFYLFNWSNTRNMNFVCVCVCLLKSCVYVCATLIKMFHPFFFVVDKFVLSSQIQIAILLLQMLLFFSRSFPLKPDFFSLSTNYIHIFRWMDFPNRLSTKSFANSLFSLSITLVNNYTSSSNRNTLQSIDAISHLKFFYDPFKYWNV